MIARIHRQPNSPTARLLYDIDIFLIFADTPVSLAFLRSSKRKENGGIVEVKLSSRFVRDARAFSQICALKINYYIPLRRERAFSP